MKRTLALLLAVILVLCLAACGGKTPANDPANDPANNPSGKTDDQPDNPPEEQQENPWTEVSADEVYNHLGFRFGIPDGSTNIIYRWDDKDGIAEMLFTDIHGVEITARAKRTLEFEDISGMEYDFSQNPDNYGHGPDLYLNNDSIDNLRGDWHLLNTDEGMVNLGQWFYEGSPCCYSFSISAVTDAGVIDMHYNEVFVLDIIEGDPLEYSRDFWEAKYPDENICSFGIEVNGVEKSYYLIMSMGCDMIDWINTPFNWNGWHLVGNDIVNKDETYKMTDDWTGEDPDQSFSSFCTVTTEPYDPEKAQGGNGDAPTAYNFKGYTETADWPGEDCWKAYGLPVLPMSEDVNGTVHISDKDYIYPLNGADGIMIEAVPGASQLDAVVGVLKDAGIAMEEDQAFEKGYTAKYQNGDDEMKISVSETGSGKLTVTIITKPAE